MFLDQLLQYLLPKDRRFFPLFEQATHNLIHISTALVEFVNCDKVLTRRKLAEEIVRFEQKGDTITHEILHELRSSFITPFDREDVHALTLSLDDIADLIHGATKRIDLYKVESMPPAFGHLAVLIQKSCYELHTAVTMLKNPNRNDRIRECCVKINSIENHADDVFNNAIASLFENETNPVNIIKLKEIYSDLESATDKLNQSGQILESIIVKAS